MAKELKSYRVTLDSIAKTGSARIQKLVTACYHDCEVIETKQEVLDLDESEWMQRRGYGDGWPFGLQTAT